MTDDEEHEEDGQNWWTLTAVDRLAVLERKLEGTDAELTDTVAEVKKDSGGLPGMFDALTGDTERRFYVLEITSEKGASPTTATALADTVEEAGFRIHYERREREQRSRWLGLLTDTVGVFQFRVAVDDEAELDAGDEQVTATVEYDVEEVERLDTADTSTDTTSGTGTVDVSTDTSDEEQPSDAAEDGSDGRAPRNWRQFQILTALDRNAGDRLTWDEVVEEAPGKITKSQVNGALLRAYRNGYVDRYEEGGHKEPLLHEINTSGIEHLINELQPQFVDSHGKILKEGVEGQNSG